jgi:peptide/nickel transport system ATP-binding protein
MSLLAVSGLTVTFGLSPVVRDVSFTLDRGGTLGIVGESGSGKSMTALAIMGLLPRGGRAAGSVVFDGEELRGREDRQLRKLRGDAISMIFQDPLSSLNPYYTVGLQIAEAYRAHRGRAHRGGAHRGGNRAATRKLVTEALAEVGIPDPAARARQYPHQFSGGQRQRIMIAMALICRPQLLIADEATTALDVIVQAEILDLLADLRERTGLALVVVAHDLAVVAQLCDEVLVIRQGDFVEHGTTEDVLYRPQHEYTRLLIAEHEQYGLDHFLDEPRQERA